MLFLPLTLFLACHANRDYLSSIDFLISSIWPWMYSNYSSWYVLVSSLWAFLCLCVFIFVGFYLLSKDAFFRKVILFCPKCLWLPQNSTFGFCFGWYALYRCLQMSNNKVFIFVIGSLCFKCLLKNIKFSYSYHIFIVYISMGGRKPVTTCGFNCFLLISA